MKHFLLQQLRQITLEEIQCIPRSPETDDKILQFLQDLRQVVHNLSPSGPDEKIMAADEMTPRLCESLDYSLLFWTFESNKQKYQFYEDNIQKLLYIPVMLPVASEDRYWLTMFCSTWILKYGKEQGFDMEDVKNKENKEKAEKFVGDCMVKLSPPQTFIDDPQQKLVVQNPVLHDLLDQCSTYQSILQNQLELTEPKSNTNKIIQGKIEVLQELQGILNQGKPHNGEKQRDYDIRKIKMFQEEYSKPETQKTLNKNLDSAGQKFKFIIASILSVFIVPLLSPRYRFWKDSTSSCFCSEVEKTSHIPVLDTISRG